MDFALASKVTSAKSGVVSQTFTLIFDFCHFVVLLLHCVVVLHYLSLFCNIFIFQGGSVPPEPPQWPLSRPVCIHCCLNLGWPSVSISISPHVYWQSCHATTSLDIYTYMLISFSNIVILRWVLIEILIGVFLIPVPPSALPIYFCQKKKCYMDMGHIKPIEH